MRRLKQTGSRVIHGLLVSAFAFYGVALYAQDAEPVRGSPPKAGTEFQLFIENDVWAKSDRYYTNGIKLGIGVPGNLLTQFLAESATGLLNRLQLPSDGSFKFSPEREPHFGVFLGQNMYTPKRISVAAPQPFDRPWAAWSYLGVVAQRETGDRLDSAEVDIGFVGPAAGGQWVQTEWHKLIGSPKPEGWGNQIRNEPALVGTYMHKRRFDNTNTSFLPRSIEVVPHVGASLGTVMTLARAGGIVRFGHNMHGFGPDTIEPGGAMLQNTRQAGPGANRGRFEWYAFVGVDHRLVAHNIFLDGTVTRHSPSVDRRAHVYDVSHGFSVRYGWARISVSRVKRSEEFHTPLGGGGGRQKFDSINIGFEF